MPSHDVNIDDVIDLSLLERIPPQRQYQGALNDQLNALAVIAARFGLYDASDYLHKVSRPRSRFVESHGRIVVEAEEEPIAEYIRHEDRDTVKIYRRGNGFYGKTSTFDFRTANSANLKAKLRLWGYVERVDGEDVFSF